MTKTHFTNISSYEIDSALMKIFQKKFAHSKFESDASLILLIFSYAAILSGDIVPLTLRIPPHQDMQLGIELTHNS